MSAKPKVIIVGAGFGGLFAARKLANKEVDVLLIDRQNFHTFTPLIYQVATCALDPSEVAYPVRTIFTKASNIHFLLGEVQAINTTERQVQVRVDGTIRLESYDYLIVAGGSTTSYFNNPQFQQYSFELNSMGKAVQIRNHILKLFERAAWVSDYSLRDAMTTIVIVGGGPTGLETAGAIYELYNFVLEKQYRASHMRAQVILIEARNNLLTPFPTSLQEAALKQLQSLGVKVILGRSVTNVTATAIQLDDGTHIPTHTLIWAAGVKASPLAEMLGMPLAQNGRVPIEKTTEVQGLSRVYVVGDMAYLEDDKGHPYPMLIPVAQQQGTLAAKNILRHHTGEMQESFEYFDRGIMATIGRRRAVAYLFNRIKLKGWLAWLAWLGLHIITLMGFRSRVAVFLSWIWNYFLYNLPGAYMSRMILPELEALPQQYVSQNHKGGISDGGYSPTYELEEPEQSLIG